MRKWPKVERKSKKRCTSSLFIKHVQKSVSDLATDEIIKVFRYLQRRVVKEEKMDIKDSNQNGIFIARDSSTDVIVDRKGVPYAVECTALPDDSSLPTYKSMGDIQGYGYTKPKDGDTRENLGTYSMAIPSILSYSEKILPILNKELAKDENYAEKELSSVEGDSDSTVREAEYTSDGTPGIIATCLNHEQQEQVFFPFSPPIYYARIAWNCTIEDGDLSTGELMSYNSSTDTFAVTGVQIWVDTLKSAQCQFSTAGDGTIFVMRKSQNAITRDSTVLNLYYAVQCIEEGYEITHGEVYEKQPNNRLDCYLLSDSIASPVWGATSAKITTTILEASYPNLLSVKTPKDWVSDDADSSWEFTEIQKVERGIPFLAVPIAPRLLDASKNQWESSEYYSSATIATYVSV